MESYFVLFVLLNKIIGPAGVGSEPTIFMYSFFAFTKIQLQLLDPCVYVKLSKAQYSGHHLWMTPNINDGVNAKNWPRKKVLLATFRT